MAGSANAFSPKEWKVAVVSDATNAGVTGIGTTMYQLDGRVMFFFNFIFILLLYPTFTRCWHFHTH